MKTHSSDRDDIDDVVRDYHDDPMVNAVLCVAGQLSRIADELYSLGSSVGDAGRDIAGGLRYDGRGEGKSISEAVEVVGNRIAEALLVAER